MTASADGGWQRACARDEIAAGDKLEVELPNGEYVLLLGVGDTVVAVCADCPHQDTPLAEGDFDGKLLTCNVHLWQWDVTTGAPQGIAEMSLPRFKVEERDGDVWVGPALG